MPKVVITGACGFIGSRLAYRLMARGIKVEAIDNLSRPGSDLNSGDLAGGLFTLHRVDLTKLSDVLEVFARIGAADAVFHLAAQVAVTTSYIDRERDFLGNAVASFNVIEATKRHISDAYCLYASTNKVYGHIKANQPVGLDYPLDPYTPYGVSKATGELYFREYGREELGLTTCALRQSCIYGHHQYGVEDQGWLAWFAIANLLEVPITIYGDGRQVRDLLFVEDLIDLYLECWEKRLTGVYPVGGGRSNSIRLSESLDLIAAATGKEFADIRFDKPRPGDQPYFVADLSWTGQNGISWVPKTPVQQGIRRMVSWMRLNVDRLKRVALGTDEISDKERAT